MFQIASFKTICTDSTEILFSQILLKYFFKTKVCWFELSLAKTKFFRWSSLCWGYLISIAYWLQSFMSVHEAADKVNHFPVLSELTVELTIISHKIKMCVFFGPIPNPHRKERKSSFRFLVGYGGRFAKHILMVLQRTTVLVRFKGAYSQSTNKSKWRKLWKYNWIFKINTHPFLLFFFI